MTITTATSRDGAVHDRRYRARTVVHHVQRTRRGVDTRTVKARAFKTGWTSSASTAASYWIYADTVATPTIAPAAGALTNVSLVSLACATTGATIRYTVDGSDPVLSSPVYQYPFLVTRTTTVKARAFLSAATPSAVATAAYTLDPAGQTALPAISPGGGRFATKQTITITGPAGATLRYTTTGVDPTDTDTVVPVSGDLTAGHSQIIKVRAWLTGSDPSAVRRADFVITGAIASGRQHSLALASDGQVWAWGRNSEGQVGIGSITATVTTPTAVLTNAVAISGNGDSSLAVRADGTVWNWGDTATGQSGVSPVQVPGLTDVAAVAAGWNHGLALKRDGTVWAWGNNFTGQLGDGTTTNRATPAPVLGLSGVTSLAAGDGFSLAVQGDGASGGLVWAWGKNTNGQLGDGSLLTRLVPVRVMGLDTAAQVAAGQVFGVARLVDGTVRAWGADASFQLGDTSAATSPVPVEIPVLSHVVWIAAGTNHAVAIDDEGRGWGWGSNANAQLGHKNYDNAAGVGAPVLIPDATAAIAASGGIWDTLILRADGTVWFTGSVSPTPDHLTLVPSFTLADNTSLFVDADTDGLLGWEEHLAGTDALRIDTNGNGLSDLVDVRRHSQSANPDDDGDGVPNAVEVARGTDPFRVDTDGDTVSDLADAFPLDATRWLAPVADPNDHTPPVITLTYPTSARPIGGGLYPGSGGRPALPGPYSKQLFDRTLMFCHLLQSSVSRCLSVCLVAGQVLSAVPVLAAPTPTAPRPPAVPPSSPAPEPPQVTVNRRVPTVTPPPSEPQFSAAPTLQEIFRARVFGEPVVPVGGVPTAGETLVVARALLALHRSGGRDWRNTVGEFLSTHPESPWRASLFANIGTLQLRAHSYARALDAWDQAWVLTKDATDPHGRAVADFAVAEWLTLAASFGQIEQVEQRLADLGTRPVSGSAGPKGHRGTRNDCPHQAPPGEDAAVRPGGAPRAARGTQRDPTGVSDALSREGCRDVAGRDGGPLAPGWIVADDGLPRGRDGDSYAGDRAPEGRTLPRHRGAPRRSVPRSRSHSGTVVLDQPRYAARRELRLCPARVGSIGRWLADRRRA